MNIKTLYNIFRNHPESSWILVQYNAEQLYKFIAEHNVSKVLDLGTGIGLSAAVMALAFKDKKVEDYKIDTIEQFEKCIRIAKELIPKELQTNINFIQSDAIAWETKEIPYTHLSIYKELPEPFDYDLIINDGPAPFIEKEQYVDLNNGTIHKLTLEGKIKSGTFVIYDGRIQSLQLLERYFADNYQLFKIPPRGQDFVVLQRIENELVFRDDRFEQIKNKTTYFKNYEQK